MLAHVPPDYIRVTSGLGEAAPLNVIVLPVLFEGEIRAVIELASFEPFAPIHRIFLEQLTEGIGVVLNMITANVRTEELLKQSQSLTEELRAQSDELQRQQTELKRSNRELEEQTKTLRTSEEMLREQQEELQQVNEELEEKALLLAEQNKAVEQKNREVEMARRAVEEKAAQLALSSRYKSEFLANMSHELRTPLNSLLILARMLVDNKDGNLDDKQVEYAKTIHASGKDLLNLINEVLDLSKVEAGKIEVDVEDVSVQDVLRHLEQAFRPVAEHKGLSFAIDIDPDAPVTLRSDAQRLQQILRNLVGNAFKFTEIGGVSVRVFVPPPRMEFSTLSLAQRPDKVIAMSVSDTGVGIPRDKQQLVFEAFQQADGTTSRKYGDGAGFHQPRLARFLGGELRVQSEPEKGSTFTPSLADGLMTIPPKRRRRGKGAASVARRRSGRRSGRRSDREFAAGARGRGEAPPRRRRRRVPREVRRIDHERRRLSREEGARRRRRRPQHLRALHGPGGGRHERRRRRERARSVERLGADAGSLDDPDGRHDAGDGWLRDDDPHPPDAGVPAPPHLGDHGQGHERRPRAEPRHRRLATT